MQTIASSEIPEAQRVVLAHAPSAVRLTWWCLLALDYRLSRIVAATNEAMLGQMRLAWWRDQLVLPAEQRPPGDNVLDAIGAHWAGHEKSLIELVNGWEALIASETLDKQALHAFAQGRAAPFVEIGTMSRGADYPETILGMASHWALVDFAFHSSTDELSDFALDLAQEIPPSTDHLPRDMRPLTLLDGLARRAIKQRRKSLLGDRLSPLFALRVGLFGR